LFTTRPGTRAIDSDKLMSGPLVRSASASTTPIA
jgi:hypothetical protein